MKMRATDAYSFERVVIRIALIDVLFSFAKHHTIAGGDDKRSVRVCYV